MPVGDLLPEVLVLLGALAIVVLGSFVPREREGCAPVLALIVVAGACVAAASEFGSSARPTFSGVFALDGATTWGRLAILLVSGLVIALSPEWLRSDPRRAEYPAIVLLSALGSMLLVGASDSMQLVVALLLSSITGYTLASYHRACPLSTEAGLKFFLIGALANVILLAGVAILFGVTGSTGYASLSLESSAQAEMALPLSVGVAAVCIGLVFELGAVPMQSWMPDVAQGAPAPSAAFLTVAPKIGAGLALARFLHAIDPHTVAWSSLVAVLATVTMTVGNLAALAQRDVRRMLGWSSVSQTGYALVAIAMLDRSESASTALIYFLLAYAVANLAAFAVVTELRGRTSLGDYGGLARTHPLVGAMLTLALLSLLGVPPLAGFTGKLLVLTATLEGERAWLAILVIANTVVSLCYYARILAPVYFASGTGRAPLLGAWAAVVMCVAGLATLVLGVTAEPLLAVIETATLFW